MSKYSSTAFIGILGGLAIAAGLLEGCSVEKTAPTPTGAADTKPAPASSSTLTTKTGQTMALIPGGKFVMGSDGGNDDERPAHEVEITSFYMDTTEVTQEAYEKLMGTNPAKHKNPKSPVEQLGWFGAIKYCNMRSMQEGLTPAYNLETLACDFSANGYRLPTEAEWEYACRAGSTSDYSFGDTARGMDAHAWFEDNANASTHPAGEKQPNPWGLHDMHGNVYEWCNDVYSESAYAEIGGKDPCNMAEGEERVLRGGSWDSEPNECRSSARYSEAPGLADVCFGYDAYGFRCVKRADAAAQG